MTITEFLLARIAEREDAAKEAMAPDWMGEKTFYEGVGGHRDDWGLWTFNVPPQLVLAECEAKRAAIDAAWGDHCRIEGEWGMGKSREEMDKRGDVPGVVAAFASVHADHADFQDEWRTA